MEDIFKNIRFEIKYGNESVSFDAKKPKNKHELADVLIELAGCLKCEGKLVVGECDCCHEFILENESHKCK